MKSAWTMAATIACLAFAGSALADPEIDQIAQQKMIGLGKKKVLACLGAPAKRARIGSTDIWTYPGQARFESPLFSPALSMGPSTPGANLDACGVDIILTNGVVSQVAYAGAHNGKLPLGYQCLFSVQNCTAPPAPFVVRATY